MEIINHITENVYRTLIDTIPEEDQTLIRLHSRYLEELGDLSFPLPMKNWSHLVGPNVRKSILQQEDDDCDDDSALNKTIETLNSFKLSIKKIKLIKTSAHLFLERSTLFQDGIRIVLSQRESYGTWPVLSTNYSISAKDTTGDVDLTTLRTNILKDVLINVLKITTKQNGEPVPVTISQNSTDNPNILCGPVITKEGGKDLLNKSSDLFKKRQTDMMLMAQHRYRMHIKSPLEYQKYFEKLGKASVTIELMCNKPQKSIKLSLSDPSVANKGPSFIFYNCARLSILLKEFNKKVDNGIYPPLSQEAIDFSLLKQPEEWELLYVYILQYPSVIKNCIKDIGKGLVMPQQLITFLSNLSSVFSVYYRRVRILTDARDHMFKLIHARIYLLTALQYVFHNALSVLNIEPVEEM